MIDLKGAGVAEVRVQRGSVGMLPMPRLQLKLSLALGLLSVSISFLYLSTLNSFLAANYYPIIETNVSDPLLKAAMISSGKDLLWSLGVIAGLFFFVSFALGIYFSHRIAGPIFQIRRVLLEHQTGQSQLRIHLRPHDELGELAEDINRTLELLDKNKQVSPSKSSP